MRDIYLRFVAPYVAELRFVGRAFSDSQWLELRSMFGTPSERDAARLELVHRVALHALEDDMASIRRLQELNTFR